MATRRRRTAVLRLGPVGAPSALRALDVQRLYPFELTIDGRSVASGTYASPLGDQAWREAVAAMERAVEASDKDLADLRRPLETVRSAGRQMFFSIAQVAPALRAFLTDGGPRRLVILSALPELHALPWEAMVDEQWTHPACADLSIVHASESFDPVADPIRPPLTVRKMFGPGTERKTEPAVDDLLDKASRRRQPRLVASADDQAASIVHIEAHGDPQRGTIRLDQNDFLDRQQSSLLVLLWSCVSNLMQPWGESLAMKLHRQHNRLVVGFTAEVREDTAGDLARRFYESVFDGTPPLDPETVITDLRCRLFTGNRLRACEWASLTVWLLGALDLDAAVLDGPRLPRTAWTSTSAGPVSEFVRQQIVRFGSAGSIAVVPQTTMTAPEAPVDIASEYRGAAVHLRQSLLSHDLEECVSALKVSAASVHPGDRLIAVVKGLAAYPDSLLCWTGVGQREVDAIQWLTKVPPSLSIVLVAPLRPDVPVGIVEGESGGGPAAAVDPEAESDDLQRLEDYEAAGDYVKVQELWSAVGARGGSWDDERRRRLNVVGYWSFIRLRDERAAEVCLVALDGIAPAEAALLRGNLAWRRGNPDEARRLYREAERLSAGNLRDEGRAVLELAYLASQRPEGGGAEVLYREALSRLERAEGSDDLLWRSALGRALRDYADVLAVHADRGEEANSLLERALIIHALDGRTSQVAAALQTRGKLERARGRFRKAEEAIGAAAALQARFSNAGGWAAAMEELIEVALDAAAPQLALALADALLRHPAVSGEAQGRIAALASRASWQLGDIEAAARWADQALKGLPASRRAELVRVATIRDVARSLIQS